MSRIGVFDSGLGGYSIAYAIFKQYPLQDIVFLADQINVPYGNKEENELEDILYSRMSWFNRQGICDVILACNTSSVLKLERVLKDFPDLRLHRIIDLTVDQIKGQNLHEVIVLATKVTVESHAYQKRINVISPKTKVFEIALVDLAKLIEDLVDDHQLDLELDRHLSGFKHRKLPFIMGCTHYPLIEAKLNDYLKGKGYSSIRPILDRNDLFSVGSGNFVCYTTGNRDRLKRQIAVLFKHKQAVLHIDI